MAIKDPVRTIPGVGPKREAALKAFGVESVGDLLGIFPRKYLDRSETGTLLTETAQCVTVTAVVAKKGTVRRIRRSLSLFVLPIEEILSGGQVVRGEAVWFNQPWLAEHFAVDKVYHFYSRVTVKKGRHVLYSPQFVRADQPGDFFELTPVYPKVEGIPPETFKKYIQKALEGDLGIEDSLPQNYRDQFDLPGMAEVVKMLHHPKCLEEVARGQRRIKFDEALKINLGILSNRVSLGPSKIQIHNFGQLGRFERGLPFELTSGQVGVLSDIIGDFREGKTINRLVQGDVGSGKTVIAVACAYLMGLSGYQTAYMAPTEILAAQHARNFEAYLKPYGITVALITGSMKPAERREVLEGVASGEVQVVIGTHALIQDSVDYYNLGMVITDEQHRFGVRQRGKLGLKGHQPHTLVMSATPIPRTLSLVLYGDLDISTIDEMPSGRKKIKTYFYGEKALPKILNFMADEMDKGYQALMICPFIEEAEGLEDVKDIERVYPEMEKHFRGRYSVGCLHGKMSDADKKRIIGDYNAGELKLLVATSIVEVGIDVRGISVITILSADRFGLSQLHQLRGRAGRGDQQAYCFLVSNVRGEKTIERMKAVVCHTNGQKIAEEDYRLRGPGDYFGCRQHGFPSTKALDPYEDLELIAQTREIAKEILDAKDAQTMSLRSRIIEDFYQSVEITMN
ncbi:ATP-dependent DNA helicase RecG [Eubacterium barkeri]|uniref:ATP-dependent DNA helicase RecG n=1 Tax=Eubacterium barkeri TaxID=1528 RepID=A0A1H3IYX8_EUBBA|nr:ATP-dependent DNA helicase RecG [Eubacterium barkeri]SDY32911.1 ATP-dependent DNA helicase RecG [Eubacterium barkeri]